jgi:catechol 2,3-dioxygenase-like lactoylglutathione lyase family enzyme
VRFDHVGIVVSDLDRALEWWQRVVGAEVDGRDHQSLEVGSVALGGPSLKLVQAQAQPDKPYAYPNDRVGAFHVCLGVPEIHAFHERVTREGATASAPPAELIPGVWAFYFRDPDGVQVQALQAGAALTLHHVGFNVGSLDRSLSWWGRAFAATPTTRADSAGPQIPRMLEVETAGYEVALLPVGAVHLELMDWHTGASRPQLGGLDPGSWHLGIGVDDVEATRDRLVQAGLGDGARTRVGGSGPQKGLPTVFVRDADGVVVQLVSAITYS